MKQICDDLLSDQTVRLLDGLGWKDLIASDLIRNDLELRCSLTPLARLTIFVQSIAESKQKWNALE